MIRRIYAALLALGMLLCCGCLRATPLDEYGYIQQLGVDKGDNKRYFFTFVLQQPKGGGESTSERRPVILGAQGNTIQEAAERASLGVPYMLNFEKVNLLVISSELAYEGAVRDIAQMSLRALKLRPSLRIVVAKQDAFQVHLGMLEQDGPGLAKAQHSLLEGYARQGNIAVIELGGFMEALQEGRFDPVATLYGVKSNTTTENNFQLEDLPKKQRDLLQTSQNDTGEQDEESTGSLATYGAGAALFDGYALAGTLDEEECKFLLIGKGELERCTYSYEDEQYGNITLAFKQTGYSQELDLEDLQLHVNVKLNCKVNLEQYSTNEFLWQNGLKQKLEQQMAQELNRVFEKCKALGSDAFGLGITAYEHINDPAAWQAYGWKTQYPRTKAVFEVELTLNDSHMAGEKG